MQTDQREARYLSMHEQGDRIPHAVLRGYLDYQHELARARKGIDDTLLAMSISDIKTRGRLAYLAEKAHV